MLLKWKPRIPGEHLSADSCFTSRKCGKKKTLSVCLRFGFLLFVLFFFFARLMNKQMAPLLPSASAGNLSNCLCSNTLAMCSQVHLNESLKWKVNQAVLVMMIVNESIWLSFHRPNIHSEIVTGPPCLPQNCFVSFPKIAGHLPASFTLLQPWAFWNVRRLVPERGISWTTWQN